MVEILVWKTKVIQIYYLDNVFQLAKLLGKKDIQNILHTVFPQSNRFPNSALFIELLRHKQTKTVSKGLWSA